MQLTVLRAALAATTFAFTVTVGCPAAGRDFDRLIPEGASFFGTARSLEGIRKWAASSPFQAVWSSKEMEPFRIELDALTRKLAATGMEKGWKDLQELLSLVSGELALVVGDLSRVDMDALRKGEVPIAILAGCPGKKDEVASLLKRILAEAEERGALRRGESTEFRGYRIQEMRQVPAPEGGGGDAQAPPPSVYHVQANEILAFGPHKRLLQDILANLGESPGKVLADAPAYKGVRARHGADASVLAYVDAAAVGRLIVTAARAEAGDDAESMLKMTDAIAAITGVQSIQAVSLSTTLSDAGIKTTLHLLAPGELKGLLKVLGPKPAALRIPPFIPEDAASSSVLRIDAMALYDLIRSLANMAMSVASGGDPGAAGGIDMLQIYEQQLGFSIREDLLAPLSGELVDYSRLRKPYTLQSQELGLLLGLRDRQRFQGTLDKLLQMVPFFKKSPYLGKDLYVMSSSSGDGDSSTAPALAISDDHLILGMPREAAEVLLRRIGKEGKSLLDTDGYKAVSGYLPAAAGLIAYATPESLEYLVHLARTVDEGIVSGLEDSDFSGIAERDGEGPEGRRRATPAPSLSPREIVRLIRKLPEGSVLTRPLAGSVTYGGAEESGLAWTMHMVFKRG